MILFEMQTAAVYMPVCMVLVIECKVSHIIYCHPRSVYKTSAMRVEQVHPCQHNLCSDAQCLYNDTLEGLPRVPINQPLTYPAALYAFKQVNTQTTWKCPCANQPALHLTRCPALPN
jgi:hypothetical protein